MALDTSGTSGHGASGLNPWESPENSVSTGRQTSGNREWLPAIRVTTVMKTNQANTHLSHPNECRYALRRGVDYWALMFEGRETIFKHELGALYVAYLLLNPPKKPLHAVAWRSRPERRPESLPGRTKSLVSRTWGWKRRRRCGRCGAGSASGNGCSRKGWKSSR